MTEKKGQLDTPAMRQYHAMKEKHQGYILMFRMGDFYEMFYDDAKVCSEVLGITLTSRSKGPSAIPLAGVPYHAAENYLNRLVKAGHSVAIAEQVENPKDVKGVVKREVVRLVTPGTLTEEALLDQKQGNYLAAVFAETSTKSNNQAVGMAWVELSSGAFHTMTTPGGHVMDELVRLGPAEVIFPEGSRFDESTWRENLRSTLDAAPAARPPWAFDSHAATEALTSHFKTKTLQGFGFDNWEASISAAGAIVEYLRETQKDSLLHIRQLKKIDQTDYMAIDGNTLRCLEVHRTLRSNQRAGSLLSCMDKTCTGMGARLLSRWLSFPLVNYSSIIARQDAVQFFVDQPEKLAAVRELLKSCSQIDRISTNIAMARVRPRELVALGQTLATLPTLAELLVSNDEVEVPQLIRDLQPFLLGLDKPAELIGRAIEPDCPSVLRDGGVMHAGFDEELDRLRSIGTDGRAWLAEYQRKITEETNIPLKVGFNKVFGYYIEITHAHAAKAPANFVRKQTLKNAERYITDELKKYESEVLTASERAKDLENRLFEQIRVELLEYLPGFQDAAEAMATLDVLGGLGQIAADRNYTRPAITQENALLNIVGGKHPVLAEQLREQFVPNDVKMSVKDRLLIITGPNMAGKSTYIRQVALLTLLAQTGSFIPAESATIGLADRIFTRVGAADELTRGLSTFMLEMVETANILNNATPRSLVILDEVGRGTSTCDGLSLAWAICEYIALNIKCRTLFATHYHELTELENLLDGTANLNVSVREWADEVIFLHKIIPGGTDQSYGVHVARLAGVPKDVIDRAKSILPQLQAHLAEGLDMPELAHRAQQAAVQMQLFANPASRIASDIKHADLDNMTPIQALEFLRKLKEDL